MLWAFCKISREISLDVSLDGSQPGIRGPSLCGILEVCEGYKVIKWYGMLWGGPCGNGGMVYGDHAIVVVWCGGPAMWWYGVEGPRGSGFMAWEDHAIVVVWRGRALR